MRAATKLGAGLLVVAAGWALLSSVEWDDQTMRTIDPGSRARPTGTDGRWGHLRAGWDVPGSAYLTIVAGGRTLDPPNCQIGVCATNPYAQRLEVRRLDVVVFTVQTTSGKGRVACWVLAPQERWDAAPPGARNDNGERDNGRVECTRTVTW